MLVAPWLNPDTDEVAPGFFDFAIDRDLAGRTNGLTIIVAKDDEKDVQDSVKLIQRSINGVKLIALVHGGHFTFKDMQAREFPELRDVLLS